MHRWMGGAGLPFAVCWKSIPTISWGTCVPMMCVHVLSMWVYAHVLSMWVGESVLIRKYMTGGIGFKKSVCFHIGSSIHFCFRNCFLSIFMFSPCVQNQLYQARYAHIPIGNLPSNFSLFVSDVFYSRHLTRHNHILWVSPSDNPDLGGVL